MKKLLALVLTLVMTMALVVTSNAAFTDAADIEHTEAVEVLNALNVINGKEDGSFFDPNGTVTRAEMAKMITVIMLGDVDVTAFKGTTTDLKDATGWAEAYIKYCYSQGIIAGKGNGLFDGNANVTAAEAAKMLLVAIGYNADVQGYTGAQWAINVTRDAQLSGFYKDLSVGAYEALTRDEAAQMIYNAVDTGIVKAVPNWNSATGVVTYQYQKQADTDDLLKNTFDMISFEGYLDAATYNESTKKFNYSVDPDALSVADDSDDVVAFSTTDFSDLMGQKVKVLYKVEKDGTKTAYGIYSTGAVASATVGELSIGTGAAASDKKVTLAGTTYNLNAVESSIDVYQYINGAVADIGYNLNAITADKASDLTLVDTDKDGKYDYAIVLPVTVAKVTYVGNKSITASAVYTFEDNKIASGIAKDDFVKIVAADNSVYDEAVITKIDTIQGKITAMKNSTDVQIDGVWYKRAANDGDTPAVNNTVVLAIVGGYYYDVETVDGKSIDNVLMVLAAGDLASGLADGAEAKVMYAKDGTIATVKVSKVGSNEATSKPNAGYATSIATTSEYVANANLVVGAMYTYTEKNGALELKMLSDNVVGSTKFAESTTAFVANATKPTVDGKVIADDAIVMVYRDTLSGTTKSSFITGATLKTWKSNYGDTVQYLYEKVNGIDTVTVIALYDSDATIPGMSGSTGYGYVTGTTYYVKENSTSYAVMDIWTADGQLTSVRAESLWDDTLGTPAFATPDQTIVTSAAAAKKGAFVSFEKLTNGNIAEVKSVGTAYALTGMYVDRDGETELTLDADGIAGGEVYGNITKDTVVVYVDTDKKTGAEGGELALAQETTIDDTYVLNVVAAISSGDVTVLFVDVNNNLASNSDLGAFSASGSVTAFDADTKVVTITANTAAATVATDATTAFGALAAQLNDTNSDGDSDSGETITVVAKDGSSYTYTIA